MALDTTRFKNYTYIQKFGITLPFIEFLLSELQTQSHFSGASNGIELPTSEGAPKEVISLQDAAELVVSWSEEGLNLEESEGEALLALAKRPGGISQVSIIINESLRARVSDPHKLLSTRLIQNVAALKEAQVRAGSKVTDKYDPARAIQKYNTTLTKLQSLANDPNLRRQLGDAMPEYLRQISGGDINEKALIELIITNLPALAGAATLREGVPDIRDNLTALKLEKIIAASNPRMAGFMVLLGDPTVAGRVNNYIQRLANSYQESVGSLAELDGQAVAAAKAVNDLLPSQQQLSRKLADSLPNLDANARKKLVNQIIRETISSSSKPLTADEIIKIAGNKINLQSDQINLIINKLHEAGQNVAIEYRQQEMVMLVGSHELTATERSLIKRGVNPFHTAKSLDDAKSDTAKALGVQESSLSDEKQAIARLEKALSDERATESPNYFQIHRFESLLDTYHTHSLLTNSEKRLVFRSRTERYFRDVTSRSHAAETHFFDRWAEIEEKLPWNKAIHKSLDIYDRLVERLIIKIPYIDRKSKENKILMIPLIGFVPWAVEKWHTFKYTTAVNWLKSLRGTKTVWGKFAQFSIRNYLKGGVELDGALYSATREAWGKSLNWLVQRSSKYATYSALRGAAIKSAGEFATKVFLKIGGQAALSLGSKAITAIIAATTAIGAIISFASIALMVVDLLKLGYNFVKEFLRNANFREKVLKIGAVIGGIFTLGNIGVLFALALATIGTLITSLLVLMLQTLFFVGIALISVIMITRISKITVNLDSGAALFASVFCNKDAGSADTETSSDSTSAATASNSAVASCASCLVDYLTACYGKDVTNTDFTSGVGCLIAKAVAPEVAAIIERSATSFTYLQCVGFVQASVACAGGSLTGMNACNYVAHPSFVSGLGGAKPGDAIVFNSTAGCTDEAPGHIGILSKDAGALVCLIDANSACSGCVSANNCLPKTNVAGYLKL